ncbi:MAG: hypothetical protein ACI9PC_001457 [Porticoccaceae bacterium]|jgi:hypothetical protein
MMKSPAILCKVMCFVFTVLLLTACGSHSELSATDNTINVYYTKGPVTGATGLLKDIDGNTVAGPVTTVGGQATFERVSYLGPVYVVFSGGTYTDEATGKTVTLDSSFEMRSGIVDSADAGAGTLALTATPLTEIGFLRAVTQNGGNVSLDTVNNLIYQVADEYGLDNINLTTLVPTVFESITGSSEEDRYGAVLAAITQQQLNSSQTPNTASLENYIKNSVKLFDQGAFSKAVLDLQTNAVTQSDNNSTVLDSIVTHIGISGHTIGGFVSDLAERVILKVNNVDDLTINANGIFTFSTSLLIGTNYTVTVSTQPVGQTCSISNGSGTVKTADVTNIVVSCVTNPEGTYSIGGSITGLSGTLVLINNYGNNLTITSSGNFNFVTRLLSNSAYSTSISIPPVGQICSISNDGGTVATANVTNIVVSCIDKINFVWFTSNGSPIGYYWYLGDNKWERETEYDLQSLTEISGNGSLITLSNNEDPDPEIFVINLEAGTITSSRQHSEVHGILEFGCQENSESNVICPPPRNDHTPIMTSAAVVEVNTGRSMVLRLTATDKDLPRLGLNFSLTDNPQADNDLFIVSNFIVNNNAACRAGSSNEGHPNDINNDNYFFIEEGMNTLQECQAACNEYPLYPESGAVGCKGIEYRAKNAVSADPLPRCEIWKTSVWNTVPQPDYRCSRRTTLRPGVLQFINAPDFRISLDGNADNVYEVEVEVSDEDGKSSIQLIEVTVIPSGEYLGRSGTACRAGTNNEGHPKDPDNSTYFTIKNDVNSLEACQALCNAGTSCKGIEYRVEGADYADTTSRCELWRVPVVATTPQKEYACYVRSLVRDVYGPDANAYVGEYKASYIAKFGQFIGQLVSTTMTLSRISSSKLLWKEDGKSWEITKTTDRDKLKVGNNYPYLGDGFEEPMVFWEADEVAGIVGPFGRIYRTDWAQAKLSHSQAIYRRYINKYPSELIRVDEAERQIRELKWAIAENVNTAAAYRAYKKDIKGVYGRTQEADRRIGSFIAFVTADVLQIEVDKDVSDAPYAPELNQYGENGDLELFYNLEFTHNWNARAGDAGWSESSLILSSAPQDNGSLITNINAGVFNAFMPAGNTFKIIEAKENETLRYGGLMFEMDSIPSGFSGLTADQITEYVENCNLYGPGDYETRTCKEIGADLSNYPISLLFGTEREPGGIHGVFSKYWNGNRTWAGNASSASASLDSSYFTIALEDLEYNVPVIKTETIKFESDEEIRIKYEFTKRNELQNNEFLEENFPQNCEEPAFKTEKLTPRSAAKIDAPGFVIRNETDHTYSISLNQVGPLYHGEVGPGELLARDTAWGHFTIDAKLNLTGEQRYDDWDIVLPIVDFTANVLLSVVTAGAPISSMKAAMTASLRYVATTSTKFAATSAARAGASALARTAFGRAFTRAGVKAIELSAKYGNNAVINVVKKSAMFGIDTAHSYGLQEAFDAAFAQVLVDTVYTKENTEKHVTWKFSGSSGNVGMYHLVGGPRLACLDKDGNVEISGTELQILSDGECFLSPLCTM